MNSADDQTEIEALRERVAELEESREEDLLRVRNSVQSDMEQYRQDVLKPRVAELEAEVEELRDELDEQREELANITGPADGEPTKPEQRTRAVRKMMVNQAQTRDHGTLGWYYDDVIDHLETNGHGKVYPTQAYRIMKDAAEADGFGYTQNDDGQDTLRVSLAALPAHGSVNNVNNAEEVSAGENTTETAVEVTND